MSDSVKRDPEFLKRGERYGQAGLEVLKEAASMPQEEFLKKHPRLDFRNRKPKPSLPQK